MINKNPTTIEAGKKAAKTKKWKRAQKLGMKTCWARYGLHMGKPVKADYEINKFEELLKMILSLKKGGSYYEN